MYSSSLNTLLLMIKSAVTSKEVDIADNNVDWNEVYSFAASHQIAPIVYYGIHNSNIEINKDILMRYKKSVINSIRIDEMQTKELNTIISLFEENKVEYMILKGANIKKLYKNSNMRTMSDIDILIKKSSFEKSNDVMNSLHFNFYTESDHEFIWKKDPITVELHKRLIPSYYTEYLEYFGDGWKNAKKVDSLKYQYKLSNNDEFIFLFTHFAKHYKSSGIGLKHLIDLYVYRFENALDYNYINIELKKLNLYDFYKNIIRTLDALFCDGKKDDKTDFITNKIFESLSYGNEYNRVVSNAVRETKTNKTFYKTKKHIVFSKIFPSYEIMQKNILVLIIAFAFYLFFG